MPKRSRGGSYIGPDGKWGGIGPKRRVPRDDIDGDDPRTWGPRLAESRNSRANRGSGPPRRLPPTRVSGKGWSSKTGRFKKGDPPPMFTQEVKSPEKQARVDATIAQWKAAQEGGGKRRRIPKKDYDW